MANLAEALKNSIPAEGPAEDPIAPEPAPDIEAQFESEPDESAPEPEPEPEPKPEPEKAKTPDQMPWKAYKAEKEKRQKAEEELAYLRGRLDGQPKDEDKGPSDDDLDNEFLIAPSATLNSRVETKLEEKLRDVKANTSDAIMRMTKEDYPELLEEFAELADADPNLWVAARQQEMPAVAIYNYMKARKNPQQNVDEKKLREEIRAELEEEYKRKAAIEEIEETPPSPAGAPGSGEAPSEKFKTIDDLFAKRRRAVY